MFATRAAIYRSLLAFQAQNRKNILKGVFFLGGPQKILQKYPKTPGFLDPLPPRMFFFSWALARWDHTAPRSLAIWASGVGGEISKLGGGGQVFLAAGPAERGQKQTHIQVPLLGGEFFQSRGVTAMSPEHKRHLPPPMPARGFSNPQGFR